MKNFWEYLKGVVTGNRKFPVFWFILLITLISSSYPVFHLAKTGARLSVGIPEFARQTLMEVYPENLTLEFKDGLLTTNVTEPYLLKIKVARMRELLEMFDATGGLQLPKRTEIRLVTIDTKATAADFDRYQTLALLTRDKLIVTNDGSVREYTYSEIGDQVVTRSFLEDKLNTVLDNKWLKLALQFGAWVLIPLTFIFIWGFSWVHALFMGLIVYLIGRLMQVRGWKYSSGVVVAVMIFFVFDFFEAWKYWVPNSELFFKLFASIWQLIAYVIIYGLFRSVIKKNENKN